MHDLETLKRPNDAAAEKQTPKRPTLVGDLAAQEKLFQETEFEVEHFLKFGKDASPLIVLVDMGS